MPPNVTVLMGSLLIHIRMSVFCDAEKSRFPSKMAIVQVPGLTRVCRRLPVLQDHTHIVLSPDAE